MRKYFSLIYKDFLLLVRDKAGLLFLFVMPLLLVMVMTCMQESAFEDSSRNCISLIILNSDKDEIGLAVEKELQEKGIFNVDAAKNSMTESELQNLVSEGTYLIGVVIPENTTAKIKGNVQKSIEKAFSGLHKTTLESGMEKVSIKVFIDPTINNTFRAILMSYLREASSKIENDYMLAKITDMVNNLAMLPIDEFSLSPSQPIGIEEITSFHEDEVQGCFNAALHNVPAWTLFAIFFIVISLSGNVIKERHDGCFARLMTMPCGYSAYLLCKVVVYVQVCLTQFLMVLLMGSVLFPVIGLPAFTMHGTFFQCLFVVFCASFAAIGYGMLISAFSKTHQQASIFGAISVVILSAIGGIWVPTFLMPDFFKVLSAFSPMNWGIEAFYGLILRNECLASVLPECFMLLAFAMACFLIALLNLKKKSW